MMFSNYTISTFVTSNSVKLLSRIYTAIKLWTMKWTHYTICNYQQPVLFWSIIILTVFFFFFSSKQQELKNLPLITVVVLAKIQNFFHTLLFTFYWLYTRERCGLHQNRGERRGSNWERQERSDGGGTAWRVFFTRHEEGKGSPYYDDSLILFLLNMPQSKQLSMMYEYDPSNPIIIVIFLLSLCNLNPPQNSSAPPPLLMIYRASWL